MQNLTDAELFLVHKILDAVRESPEHPNVPAIRTVTLRFSVPEVIELPKIASKIHNELKGRQSIRHV